MLRRRTAALLPVLVAVLLAGTAGVAAAEHRASRATFNTINRLLRPSARTIDDHLTAVWISDRDHGPWALATESGSQGYRELMHRVHRRWRFLAGVGAATELPCSVAPRAVHDDLHLLRDVPGPPRRRLTRHSGGGGGTASARRGLPHPRCRG